MKLSIQRIFNKILIISIITVLMSFFCVNSVSEAKLKLKDGEFYYTGTQEAQIVKVKSFWDKIFSKLSQIFNYLLGVMTLGFRGIVVGWIEVFELILTVILQGEVDFGNLFINNDSTVTYKQEVVNIESIIFNSEKIPILDVNLFNFIYENLDVSTLTNMQRIVIIIRNSVAKWYYIMRLMAIAFMLIVLLFVGIKMAISTIAEDKALYKRMLVDWVAGMVLVFSIHYIMIGILSLNDTFVSTLENLVTNQKLELQEEYEYGLEEDSQNRTAEEVEMTLYETARTRAYSLKMTDGFTGMIVYGALVYYAWKFALIYIRRMINIVILTLLAPAVSASYAINKVLTGKSKVFSTWLSEYFMNVIIQTFHALMYVSFVTTIYTLVMKSFTNIILAFVLFNFMSKAGDLLRQIFRVSGGMAGKMAHASFRQMAREMRSTSKAMVGGKIGKMAVKTNFRVATKPLRKGVELGFGKYVETKANRANEELWVKENEKDGVISYEKLTQKEYENSNLTEEEKIKYKKIKRKDVKDLEKQNKKFEEYKAYSNWDERNEKKMDLIDENIDILNQIKNQANKVNLLENDSQADQTELEKEKEELLQLQIKAENNKQEIKKLETEEEMYQDMFLRREQYNNSSTKAVLKQGLENLFDYKNYVDDKPGKDGKYHKKKTVRKGEMPGTVKDKDGNPIKSSLWAPHLRKGKETRADLFWREKEKGIGKTFWENAKWDKLLGVSAEEKKLLQETQKYWKESILGVASGIAGIATIGANPLLGMTLLANSGSTFSSHKTNRVQRKIKKIQYKNNHTKKKYHVSNFNTKAKENIAFEQMKQIHLAESRLTRHNMKKHQKLTKKIMLGKVRVSGRAPRKNNAGVVIGNLKVSETTWKMKNDIDIFGDNAKEMAKLQESYYVNLNAKKFSYNDIIEEKLDGMYQKKIREQFKQTKKELVYENTKTIRNEYKNTFNSYEEKLQEDVEKKSKEKLLFNDYGAKENVAFVGNNVFEIVAPKEENRFMNNIESIDNDSELSRRDKIEKIKDKIEANKTTLIKEAIIKTFAENGIVDIENSALTEEKIISSKNKILQNLENQGIIRKGEISLEDTAITNDSVRFVYQEMTHNKEQTNEELEVKLVQDAYLEYMQKNNITDVKNLKNDDTKQEIYDIIKLKVMPEDSQKSADVIEQLTGQKKMQEEINISDTMKSLVDKTADNVKEVDLSSIEINQNLKEKLIEREVNREVTKTKKQLEDALFTQNGEDDLFENDNMFDYDENKKENRFDYSNYFDNQENTTEEDDVISEIDQKKLQLLFLVSEMQKQNEEGKRVGIKSSPIENHKIRNIQSYQNNKKRFAKQESKNQKATFAGSQKIGEKIYGPVTDITEMINVIGNNPRAKRNNARTNQRRSSRV